MVTEDIRFSDDGVLAFSDLRILGAAATFLLSQASIQAILEVTQKIRVLYLRPGEFQQPIKIRRINGFKVQRRAKRSIPFESALKTVLINSVRLFLAF